MQNSKNQTKLKSKNIFKQVYKENQFTREKIGKSLTGSNFMLTDV